LLTFGPSYVRHQAAKEKLAERDPASALLAPFVEGLLAAAKGGTKVIDGYELAYGFKDPRDFDAGLAAIRRTPGLAAGFGLWLDFDWRHEAWDASKPDANYFTPAAFERSLRLALARTDGLVWVYTETPRWWTPRDVPDKLPQAYVDALRRARTGQTRDGKP
jgi:hypothetical protein